MVGHLQRSRASTVWRQEVESERDPPAEEQRSQGFTVIKTSSSSSPTFFFFFLRCGCTLMMCGYSTLTVSVCQKVSTRGHRPWPTAWWYQCQASGLIGSPTEPRTFRLERSYLHTGRGRHSEILLFIQTFLSANLSVIIVIFFNKPTND